VDHDEPLLLLQATGAQQRIGEARPLEVDAGAVAARVRHLDEGRRLRHDDGRRDAEPAGVVCQRLGVVARARGDHAARPLLRAQAEQPVQRAPLLERAGALQVLQLQVQPPGDGVGKPQRRRARREEDAARKAVPGGADLSAGEHV
jgi:hypothetical protein